jgi:amidase
VRPTRRDFLQSSGAVLIGASAARLTAAQGLEPFDVTEKSIRDLQTAMVEGRVTSERLVALYLNRIHAYDQAGPRLNAVLYVNPRAAQEARELDEERKERRPRGPLHGIPVLLKDNFQTSDMPTTGGSLALMGVVPTRDAFQVAQLRRAGAVLLGKVNLHELALGLTGVSSLGGQTLNPYDLTRTPGGSSGGSGAAAAACLAAFAMGTDTSGSIRIPSSHNALVGLRPSAGLSSRTGIIPFGRTQDTGGPMARTVEDVALILDATAGYDLRDATTSASSGRMPRSYTSSLKPGALQGARIGVLAEFFGVAPEDQAVAAVIRRAIAEMTTQGATAVDVVVPDLARLVAASNLLTQELKADLNAYLTAAGAHAPSIEEMLDSGLHSAAIQGILDVANATPPDYLAGDDYKDRLAARETLATVVLKVMDANRLDALVYPTIRRIAPLVGGAQQGSNAALSANSGLPAITVPAGFTADGFPVGVELLGRRFAEARLLALAFDYEQATRHRRLPATTPPLTAAAVADAPTPPASLVAGVDSVRMEVTAAGTPSVPPAKVPFQARAQFLFHTSTRVMEYDVRINGSVEEVAGVYLHRRASRPNGGVAHVLGKSAAARIAGRVTLTAAEAGDFKAGRLYLSVISRTNPRRGLRADLVPPSA